MPKYVIERDIAGAGLLTDPQLRQVSRNSRQALEELGPSIQWVESHVTRDRVYCVYVATDEALVREHALRGGLPADRISRVSRTIDPTTAE